ncbi:MAG: hypothetical protein HKN08_07695 [Gammaproteobacteria bacterium]|nr:hypothetical protein [Gammaproteobacteria bacterium]
MNTRNNNKASALLPFIMLAFLVSPMIHAQEEGSDNGRHTGFEQGNHKGHDNGKGKQKGLENERNPWSGYGNDPGVDFELTIINHAITPMVTIIMVYNSRNTVGEVLADVIGGAIDGFVMQDCYTTSGPLSITDCPAGQTPVQLDIDMTLESAGLVENSRAHIFYTGE